MKKSLFLIPILLFSLILSPQAHAIEYNIKDITKKDNTFYGKDNKPITGVAKAYYENGNLQVEINLKDGKASGIGKSYYENGNLQAEINYEDGVAVNGFKYTIDGKRTPFMNFEYF